MLKPNQNQRNCSRTAYLKGVLTIFLFMTLTVTYSQCIPPPPDMVSWWDGDSISGVTVTDIEGSNNGTLQNGATTSLGHVGDAFKFDGSDYLSTPLTINFYSGGVTFDAWVKTTDGNGMIISDGGGVTTGRGMGLFIENNGKLRLYGTDGTSGITNFYIESPQAINDDQFHLIAATWTGDTADDGVKLFIDGVEVGSATAGASITSGTTPIYIGGHGTIGHNKLDGLIDEVEIFDRALTDCEIFDLFDAGVSGKCKTAVTPTCIAPPSDMISWWDGDEVLMTTATDIEGSNDGTLENGATTSTGHVGDAFKFDGSDYLSTPLTINFYSGGVTFDAWVKTTDGNGMIISDGGGTTIGRGMGLFIENNGKLRLYGTDGTSGITNFYIESPQAINDGQFHLIAATWTGDTVDDGVKLFIDGEEVGSTTANSSITSGTTPIYIGGHGTIGHNKLDGLIDEVEIFDRALADCEIIDLYKADTLGKCKPQLRKKSEKAIFKENDFTIEIYPNPSSGYFSVLLSEKENANILILDEVGKVLLEEETNGKNKINFDVSNYPKGLYYIRAIIGDEVIVKKLINN